MNTTRRGFLATIAALAVGAVVAPKKLFSGRAKSVPSSPSIYEVETFLTAPTFGFVGEWGKMPAGEIIKAGDVLTLRSDGKVYCAKGNDKAIGTALGSTRNGVTPVAFRL